MLLAIAEQASTLIYQSDCRGRFPFYLWIAGKGMALPVPQIPVTLPTFDELLGRKTGVESYNRYLTSLLLKELQDAQCYPVYTIHAEVEGRAFSRLFSDLLNRWIDLDIQPVPLSKLIANHTDLPRAPICTRVISGRTGWIASQGSVQEE